MSLKKNVIANYLGNGWAAIMSLVFIPVYLEYLGMEAYGLIGIYTMLQASLALVDAGMTPTLTREISRFTGGEHSTQTIRNLLRTLETISCIIAIIFAAIIWLGSAWLANSWLKVENLPLPVVSDAFTIMGIVTATRLLEGLYRGAMVGLQKQVALNILSAGIVTLRNLGAALVLAFWSPTINAYFFWQGVISFLAVVSFSCLVYKSLPPAEKPGCFSSFELLRVWRFAAGILVTTFLALILTQIDKILLSKILTLKEFGHYNFATTVANSLMLLVGPIAQAHYPRITELQSQKQPEAVKQIFHQGAQLITVFVGVSTCIIIFFGESLLFLWTGNEELVKQTILITRILVIGTMLNGFMNMPYLLQLSFGITGFTARVNLISVLILAPALFLITPIYGSIGAAGVWLLLNACYVFIISHFMFKITFSEEKTRWFRNDLLKPFTAAFLIILFFWFIKPDFSSKIIEVIFIATSGLAAFASSVALSSELKRFLNRQKQPSNTIGVVT